MGLEKCTVTCIHHCSLIQSIFTTIECPTHSWPSLTKPLLLGCYTIPIAPPILLSFKCANVFFHWQIVDGITFAEGKVFIMLKICVLYLSPAIYLREKAAFFMSLVLKLHRFQLSSESGYASKDLSFFKMWCLKWKAAMLFIYYALRNSFSQMEGHKNDGLLSCSLKLHSPNTWNIDIKSSCTWFSPYESF